MTEKAVADEVIARMRARYDSHLPLIPGAVEAVRRVAASWPLGLASSSPRRLIDAVLARAGLDRLFAATVSTEEVARGKPAPDVYQAVARMLGSLPGDCVAVEDSGNGLRAAVAAGMRTVLVARPEYPVDAEVRQTAALTLGDIQQLTPHALVALDR